MDQEPELTFEESIKEVMQTLPPVIRAYLTQGKYTTVARELMTKYALRLDQGGVLEREIMLLLMGIESPDEFTKALAEEAKIDQKAVDGIVRDINAQIFIPLREEERKGEEAKKPVLPPPSRPVVVKPVTPAPTPIPPRVNINNTVPPRPMPPRPAIAAPKPLDSSRLLEDHEEPHINFPPLPKKPEAPAKPVEAVIKPHIIPAGARAEPVVAPKIEVAPVPPPAAVPPPQPQPTPPAPVVESNPVPAPAAQSAPPAKPRVDPYREPIEE